MSRSSYATELESILEPFLRLVQQYPDEFPHGYESDGFRYEPHNGEQHFHHGNIKFATFREGRLERYTIRHIPPDDLLELREFVASATSDISKESR